jgi:hypothetical protein
MIVNVIVESNKGTKFMHFKFDVEDSIQLIHETIFKKVASYYKAKMYEVISNPFVDEKKLESNIVYKYIVKIKI